MRPLSTPLVSAAALLGVLACTKPDHTADADSAKAAANGSAATPSATANAITVTARDFAFDAPTQIPAGVTTINFVNHGQQLHHVQILKFEQGKTVADYQAALKAGGPPPTWATEIGGPNAPVPGGSSSATLTLDPGTYAYVCFIDTPDHMPHLMKGMSQAFTVTPASGPSAPEPTADVTLTLSDYDFVFSQPLTAGKHLVRIVNTAAQPHEVLLVRLDSGKTVDDVLAWTKDYKGAPPGQPIGGITGMAPGRHGFVPVELTPGNYGLICFMPDMKDGKPHFMHGMKKQFTI